MEYIMIGVIVVIMIICVIMFVSIGKKDKKESTKSNTQATTNNTTSAPKDKVKKEDVFKFMEFDRISDNMIIQNGGKRYTMAIKCKGINYDLMSEVEQMAVEQGFITFLNTLKYPIQLYVQAQNIDLKHVVNGYKKNIAGLREEYNKYNKLSEEKSGIFDINKDEVEEILNEKTKIMNVYEYANDIISYVEKMSVNKNLLQRNFYVLVSYSKGDIVAADKFTKEEINEMCYTELLTRCNSIISALASSSVSGRVLNSNELADLLYIAYNRDDKSLMGVRDALESGFYRLYSTSVDAFQRKDEMLNEAISAEARLKAIMSLEKLIEEDNYQTDSMLELETEEQIAKEATELIKSDNNIAPDIKQRATDDIIEEYREIKKEYLPKIEEEKAEKAKEVQEEKEILKEKYENSDLHRLNNHKKEVINLYNEEIKQEKEELKKVIDANSEGTSYEEEDSGENDSIL
ncbi:MAG: hypothetical protein J6A15_02050 [Clostridia bacterium]|nr:hypothetical protein [Clostridia bacterium]